MTYPKTLNEAIAAGYKISSEYKMQRGYVSRLLHNGDGTVYVAGGRRAGDLYILTPCWVSSRYCYRNYLIKVEG